MKQRPNYVVLAMSFGHGLCIDPLYFHSDKTGAELTEDAAKTILAEVRRECHKALDSERAALFDQSWYDAVRARAALDTSAVKVMSHMLKERALLNNELDFPFPQDRALCAYFIHADPKEDREEAQRYAETVYLLCRI